MRRTQKRRIIKHKRVRAKIKGTGEHPRLCVFRSNVHIFAQLVDDVSGKTIVSASDLKKKGSAKKISKKVDIARSVGLELAKEAGLKKIKAAVFDRGGYKYHGRVKAVAEGAREGGLRF